MPEKIVIVIEMQPDGKVSVTGPLGNRSLMYGLLEIAKDVVRAQPAGEPPSVIMPQAGLRWNQ